ncbi:hypothetical protein B0T24DRAFT_690163 [Lasiosphaeria ovina]|uniref:chitinase n=1 Tax=Lasiosphaeria ovina TaxID=92902 RepID=A0AAE0MYL9_9PEZI|nr:hypothetical protein B0T24DRAFT_690163 [Lasiosphaeria ovina]
MAFAAVAMGVQTSIFDIASFNTPVDQPGTDVTIRACTIPSTPTTNTVAARNWHPLNSWSKKLLSRKLASRTDNSTAFANSTTSTNSTEPTNSTVRINSTAACNRGAPSTVLVSLHEVWWNSEANSSSANEVVAAAAALRTYVGIDVGCEATIIISQSGSAIVGLGLLPDRIGAEVCGTNTSSTQSFGIFATASGDIGAVQKLVKGWSNGGCLSAFDGQKTIDGGSIDIHSAIIDPAAVPASTKRDEHALDKRGTCQYIQAAPNNGCWAVADKCHVSQDDIRKFDPAKGGKDICNNVQAGMYFCCNQGSLPDFTPNRTRTAQYCSVIAEAHKMTVDQLEERNKNSWGFAGCQYLMEGQMICLSTGKPQLPNSDPNYHCGPQVRRAACKEAGAHKLTGSAAAARLHSLHRDQVGHGSTGHGTNGCISNCGTDIKRSNAPASLMHVGYFEAWNLNRDCLHMDISQMTKPLATGGSYTHVHFAFAALTRDYNINITAVKQQFDGLKKLTGIKKILSFGGWSFSTDADTFLIFRQGVIDANRATLVKNVVRFINDNGLDGVDFDWEYPGAPDISDVPPGGPEDAPNYLTFLRDVRKALPDNKTVSIAVPASFWYLKQFPIKQISAVVDYIIYMTYGLHGQWDYDNKKVNDGCFNCARHHVNTTEVDYALSMITKAGVPSNKVIVGMDLYGRTFGLTQKGCRGNSWTFGGKNSTALKGWCTDTAGYISNYEIREILAQSGNDELQNYGNVAEVNDKDGDLVYYNDDQYTSWMKPDRFKMRSQDIKNNNFAGLSDWAADLDVNYGNNGTGDVLDADDGYEDAAYVCDFSTVFRTLDEAQRAAGGKSPECIAINTVQAVTNMLNTAADNYTNTNNGYDTRFDAYVCYVKNMIPGAIDKFMMAGGGTAGNGMKCFDCEINEIGNPSVTKPCGLLAKVSDLEYGTYDVYFHLRDSGGFYKDLLDTSGIPQDWVTLTGSRDFTEGCTVDPGAWCPPSAGNRRWYNYPDGKKDLTVANPKDLVTGGLCSLDELLTQLAAASIDLMLGTWRGSYDDVIDVLSLPVSMLQAAVDAMAQVKILGGKEEDIEAKEKRDQILGIIGAVLFVVPFLGEAGLAAAGLTNLARIASVAREVANGAFSIYEFVDNKDSIIMALFEMLLGAGGLAMAARDAAGFASMATKRRFFSADAINKIGGIEKAQSDILAELRAARKTCKLP